MKIKEINIIRFGKFADAMFTLLGGFNVIRGDNESGKSTLLAFIKFALYGVGRKNPNVTVGERERAISWNAGVAAGSLTVEDEGGKLYRIERAGREGARGTYADKARIIDVESGAEVFEGEVPGEHFLGIPAQAYDSMCSIRQLETVLLSGEAVKSVIDNLLSSGDENTSVQAAIKMLDTERRRLMHTNGKGGLVFESELALERLKSEYKGAQIYENELIKNRDELERVELALSKARAEFEVAQRMCDMHDDVLRLQKFDKLKELREDDELVRKSLRELDAEYRDVVREASYERISELRTVKGALERSRETRASALAELDAAKDLLDSAAYANESGLSDILDEFEAPRIAASFVEAKRKKASGSGFLLTSFGIGGSILVIFACILAFAMNNAAGAMTVAFIGAILCSVAFVSYRQAVAAKAELESFFKRLGEEHKNDSGADIEALLDSFAQSRESRTKHKNAIEGAKFRLSVAEDAFNSDLNRARAELRELGINEQADLEGAIDEICGRMREYLSKREVLENGSRENEALLRSLSGELARFSESDIRARLTPQIIEKIEGTSFEKLKAERDLALHRTNHFGQYKAGIERNLAASGGKRASSEIFPEIEAESEYLDSLKLRLDAVKLAMETVNAASLSIKSDVTPHIRDKARENLSAATGGKYGELYIDDNMKLSVFADGATRPVESLSRGSLDAAYFSVRLALLQTLLGDKQPPLYMDECLSQLDDGRAKNVLEIISSYAKESQCVLLTCQTRDVELARSVAPDVNVIEI